MVEGGFGACLDLNKAEAVAPNGNYVYFTIWRVVVLGEDGVAVVFEVFYAESLARVTEAFFLLVNLFGENADCSPPFLQHIFI